jgi:hypothetical protein
MLILPPSSTGVLKIVPDTGLTVSPAVGTGTVTVSSPGTARISVDSSNNTLITNAAGNTYPIGYLTIPQNFRNSNYTLVLSDASKQIYFAGAGAGVTCTIPATSSVGFPIGTAITFINMSVNTLTIAITTDTMYLGGSGATGSRTLSQFGAATAVKMTNTTWIITGTALT